MRVEDNSAKPFEPDGYDEQNCNLGLFNQSWILNYFFGLFFKTALRIFLILCRSIEDNTVHRLSQMVFVTKVLITDYRRLSVQRRFFLPFFLFLKTALEISFIFCKRVEDNRDHRLNQMVFLTKVLIQEYRD